MNARREAIPYKLSARAWEILLLIDQSTYDAPGCDEKVWWTPSLLGRCTDWVDRLHRHLDVGGSGDAKILSMLVQKGLTENPRPSNRSGPLKYASRITEDGRLQIEKGLEMGIIPFAMDDYSGYRKD